ncbi:MAG: 5-(carboxyamino)imidazole ribonucleotide mutase [bacterium]|nr:5-(carboxyamino)imidazole ribonucleotide mutase [bacterium]
MNKVVIISGSTSDKEFVEKIQTKLDELNIQHEWEACSAHKETERLLGLIKAWEASEDNIVYITVAGRSNALSGVVACNTKQPVFAVPPFSDKDDFMVNINSTLQMPSNTPVMTVLDPGNAAQAVQRIFDLIG